MTTTIHFHAPPAGNVTAQALTAYLAAHAGRYLGCAGREAAVELVSSQARPYSHLYEFRVGCADEVRHLLVKVRRSCSTGLAASERDPQRPWLFPRPHAHEKAQLEYSALGVLEDRFRKLGDPRFSVVPVLDCLPDVQALVMERLKATCLAAHISPTRKLGSEKHRLLESLRDAGAWLRVYHAQPPLPHTQPRHLLRTEVVAACTSFAEYLAASARRPRFAAHVAARVTEAATLALPAELPAGLSHTDYAPRNVLLCADRSIAVCDTMSRWLAPIYEDIAHFLVALELDSVSNAVQSVLRRQTIDRYRREFLHGYFGDDDPPSPTIALFEVQQLLYRWVAAVDGYQQSRGWRRMAKRWRLAARECMLMACLKRRLPEMCR